jgi:hypothetical protein
MGNTQSARATNRAFTSEPATNNKNRKANLREHKRHGFVTVKINSNNPNRRPNEAVINHIISPKGSILYGSLFSPSAIVKGKTNYTLN